LCPGRERARCDHVPRRIQAFDIRRAAPLLSRGGGSGARQGSRGRGAISRYACPESLAERCRSGRRAGSSCRGPDGELSSGFSAISAAGDPVPSRPVLSRPVPISVPIFGRLKRYPIYGRSSYKEPSSFACAISCEGLEARAWANRLLPPSADIRWLRAGFATLCRRDDAKPLPAFPAATMSATARFRGSKSPFCNGGSRYHLRTIFRSGQRRCHNSDFQIFTDGPFGRRIASDASTVENPCFSKSSSSNT
jgi:hypothetical protein